MLLIHHFTSYNSDMSLSKHYQNPLMTFSEYANAFIDTVIRNIDISALQRLDICFVENAPLIHQLNLYCSQSFCFDCISKLNNTLQINTLQFRWFLITTDGFFRVFGSAFFFFRYTVSYDIQSSSFVISTLVYCFVIKRYDAL